MLSVYCGFNNPEDLALTPDGEFLLVTGFGGLPDTVVNDMAQFDLAALARVDLPVTLGRNEWGDASCTRTSLDFSPHGLSLAQRTEGAWQLAITNHLPAETVEFFELVRQDSGWALVWRGCAAAPENVLFNDVALTRSGGFYATEMYPADLPFDELLAAGAVAANTGAVWRWRLAEGYSKMAGTEGSFPNGIALTAQEDALFVNYWFARKTVKFNLAEAVVEFEHSAGMPDNLTRVGDEVWVATHDMTLDQLAECPADLAQCLLPFTIYKLSGADLSEQAAYSFDSKAFGAATVAIPHQGKVWLGTFHGDRIASFPIGSQGLH